MRTIIARDVPRTHGVCFSLVGDSFSGAWGRAPMVRQLQGGGIQISTELKRDSWRCVSSVGETLDARARVLVDARRRAAELYSTVHCRRGTSHTRAYTLTELRRVI